ncbi:MAG: hypothetical protein HZB18_10035 [Chloroflexi bacterium]|nr:hypothetical protein [Chloroflexota bacterium]
MKGFSRAQGEGYKTKAAFAGRFCLQEWTSLTFAPKFPALPENASPGQYLADLPQQGKPGTDGAGSDIGASFRGHASGFHRVSIPPIYFDNVTFQNLYHKVHKGAQRRAKA